MDTRTLLVLLVAGLAVGLPLAAPAASADPVTVDVGMNGWLICVFVTTDKPLGQGHWWVCTIP